MNKATQQVLAALEWGKKYVQRGGTFIANDIQTAMVNGKRKAVQAPRAYVGLTRRETKRWPSLVGYVYAFTMRDGEIIGAQMMQGTEAARWMSRAAH